VAPGLEVGVYLMNRAEDSEVGVFEKLDADIRQAVNIGSGKNPPVSAVLTAAFLETN